MKLELEKQLKNKITYRHSRECLNMGRILKQIYDISKKEIEKEFLKIDDPKLLEAEEDFVWAAVYHVITNY